MMRRTRGKLALAIMVITPLLGAGIFLLWLFMIVPSSVPLTGDEASETYVEYQGDGQVIMLDVSAHEFGYWDSWAEWASIMKMRAAADMFPIRSSDLDYSFRCFPFIADGAAGPERIVEIFRQVGNDQVAAYFEAHFLFCEQLLENAIEELEALNVESISAGPADLMTYFSEARSNFVRQNGNVHSVDAIED